MIATVKAFVRSIEWFRPIYDRVSEYKHLLMELPQIITFRIRYWKNLRKCRQKIQIGKKLKVVFLLSNPSKWKEQSLYDLMAKSDWFDPVIALTPMDIESRMEDAELKAQFERTEYFIRENGCKSYQAYDMEKHVYQEIEADIVWYTQPWDIAPEQSPMVTSKTSLTCYTPYFVQNYGYLPLDCLQGFHRALWRHFTLSDEWSNVFMKAQGMRRAGKCVGSGHPMLDQFYLHRKDKVDAKYVVYAPHFSCGICECYSTFLKYNKEILKFAQEHPEVQWVFKPHPSLRFTLIRYCGWSAQEVDSYYNEWAQIAVPCYDSNYVQLFKESMAMITDCASFLVEYACTGKPIFHLISAEAKIKPHLISSRLFNSYYQVTEWNDLEIQFDEVVLKRNDYKREVRLREVHRLMLLDNYAAKNIISYLGGCLGVR